MEVVKRAERLIHIELDEEDGNLLLHFGVLLEDAVHGLRHVVHDDIQVNFILLFALRVEGMPQSNHVGVEEFAHNLQFSVFVSLVLVDFLDGDDLACLRD